MVTDYRNKKYCPTLDNVENDKEILYKTITQKHQNAEDMHPLVADKEEYKKSFAAIYNNKYAYCGVSLRLLPLNSFETDHVRCKSSFTNSSKAGHMDNLFFVKAAIAIKALILSPIIILPFYTLIAL